MMTLRRAADRGVADFGWLDSRHSFSFGQYHDPRHAGFGPLLVINEDRVAPGAGFDTHGHRDMEIVSYVLSGALEHKDSIGTGSVIRPGEVQRMSAGTGIRHSEFNHSSDQPVHFLQIWIAPERQGLTPGYEQLGFEADEKRGVLRLIGSRDGRDGSLTIHQDITLYDTLVEEGRAVSHTLAPRRRAWIQVTRGALAVNGVALGAGDGLAIAEETGVEIEANTEAEALLFDMA